MRPCLGCGVPVAGSHCSDCAPPPRLDSRARGYSSQWDRLSRQARRMQPWCLDCGSTERLTADHKPEAWQRRALGLAVRLVDVDVVCNDCNVARGSSRPGSRPRREPRAGRPRTAGEAEFRSLSGFDPPDAA